MTRVFVFTAHMYPTHRAQSLENPVQPAKLAQVYGAAIPGPLLEAQRLAGGIFAWGMPDPKYLRDMTQGDVVLSYFDNAYQHVARVVAKHYDPRLAAAIWDPPHKGKRPYAHMFLMTKPVAVATVVRWNDAPQLVDQLPSGVVPVAPERINTLVGPSRTVEAFIRARFGVDVGVRGIPGQVTPVSVQSTPMAIDLSDQNLLPQSAIPWRPTASCGIRPSAAGSKCSTTMPARSAEEQLNCRVAPGTPRRTTSGRSAIPTRVPMSRKISWCYARTIMCGATSGESNSAARSYVRIPTIGLVRRLLRTTTPMSIAETLPPNEPLQRTGCAGR